MFFVFTHIFSNTYSVLHILVFSSVLHTSFTDRFRVIFVQVFPCISLVILNILLFSAMRRAEQRRRRLTINRTNNNLKKNNAAKQKRGTVGRYNDIILLRMRGRLYQLVTVRTIQFISFTFRRLSMFGFSKEQRDRRQRDANSTTMMLIVVIAVFLAVELPLSTMTALHTISSR